MDNETKFSPEGLTILYKKRKGEVIASYVSEYKGHKTFQIRELFQADDGNLRPSKQGFSVPEADKDTLIAAIAALAKKG